MIDVQIATIPKNRKEELRISLEEYQGHDLVNMRVWFMDKDGEMRPGKSGLALRIDLLPDLADAVSLALEHVRTHGGAS